MDVTVRSLMKKHFSSVFEATKKAVEAVSTTTSMVDGRQVSDCLSALDGLRKFPVSADVLACSPVPMRLQLLTEHQVKPIKEAASSVLDTWRRKLYERDDQVVHRDPSKSADEAKSLGKVQVDVTIKTGRSPMEQKRTAKFSRFKKPQPSSLPVASSVKTNDDGMRGKVREILVEALAKVVMEAKEIVRASLSRRDPISIATMVESVMFEKLGPFNGPNRLKYRSILFNLKDPGNPDLRRKVVIGQIKPERLVNMTSEEMASNQKQREIAQIREKSLFRNKSGRSLCARTSVTGLQTFRAH